MMKLRVTLPVNLSSVDCSELSQLHNKCCSSSSLYPETLL